MEELPACHAVNGFMVTMMMIQNVPASKLAEKVGLSVPAFLDAVDRWVTSHGMTVDRKRRVIR